jgi:hypothetical protein
MRHRMLLAWISVLGFAMISSWAITAPPVHRIRSESQGRIKLGMTRQKVFDLLGAPPGDYGPGRGEIAYVTLSSHSISSDPRTERWLAGSCAILVRFDERGSVNGIMGEHVYRPYDTPLQMIAQKLGLQGPNPIPTRVLVRK